MTTMSHKQMKKSINEDLEKNTRETIHYMTVLGKRWENEGGNQHEQVMHNKDIGNISLEEVSVEVNNTTTIE